MSCKNDEVRESSRKWPKNYLSSQLEPLTHSNRAEMRGML